MSETDCQSALRKFATRDLRTWSGLADCSLVQVTSVLPLINENAGRSMIGDTELPFATVRVEGFPNPVRVWIDEGRAVLLDTAYPEISPGVDELTRSLGQPELTLDYEWGTVKLERGEWVYNLRGLALFIVPSNHNLVHLSVFAPATTEEYERRLRLHLGKRMWPLRKSAK